jgi:hypothetical protein
VAAVDLVIRETRKKEHHAPIRNSNEQEHKFARDIRLIPEETQIEADKSVHEMALVHEWSKRNCGGWKLVA